MPYDQISFQQDEHEIARYHFGPALKRPFIFPVIGPSGGTPTRMAIPVILTRTAITIRFEFPTGPSTSSLLGRPAGPNAQQDHHKRVVDIEDGDNGAGVITQPDWTSDPGTVLLHETRETWLYALPEKESMLVIDLTLDSAVDTVTFDRAGFGPINVRVAKSIAMHFGGGRPRNSEVARGRQRSSSSRRARSTTQDSVQRTSSRDSR